MTIRTATRWDIPEITELLSDFSRLSPLAVLSTEQNPTHVSKLLTAIIKTTGTAWVSTVDTTVTGFLIATTQPLLWNTDILVLQEIAFYIKPENRGGTAAARLIHQFRKYAVEHNLPMIFTTLPSSNIDLSRHGFVVAETVWTGA